MKIKAFLAAMLVLLVAACASAPRGAGPLNPVGRYQFATSVQGNPVTGTMDVTGSAGAYTGQITTSITPPIPITGVTVMGREMIVTGNTPDGPITIRMNFAEGTAFTGSWELSGDSGTMTGNRVM